jgi:hypothetical protein
VPVGRGGAGPGDAPPAAPVDGEAVVRAWHLDRVAALGRQVDGARRGDGVALQAQERLVVELALEDDREGDGEEHHAARRHGTDREDQATPHGVSRR